VHKDLFLTILYTPKAEKSREDSAKNMYYSTEYAKREGFIQRRINTA
jgi:hypothetical protein